MGERENEVRVSESTTHAPAGAMNPTAFSALVERHTAELCGFLRGIVGSPEQARDLTQDTFYDAWRAARRRAPPFTAAGTPEEQRRWLYHSAYCRAISARRRARLIRWDSLDVDVPPEIERLAAVGAFEDVVGEREEMRAALERLSAEDAACLLLIVVHGFTAAEAAAILGGSIQAMAKRLSRAKRRLLAVYLAQRAESQEGRHP